MERIPKVIHYCWFGGNPHDELIIKCIDSWKEYLADYEVVEWNEDNFNLDINSYVREAYEAKKYAFVTDFVRLYVLFNYGGVYMDTDVEVLRNIDRFLVHTAFSGFEGDNFIPTAIMGSTKGNRWIGRLLDYYTDKKFILQDGTYDLTTNVSIITEITRTEYDLHLDNSYHEIPGMFALYPKEYFCPKSYKTGKISITENTYAIHHFNGSWLDEQHASDRDINRRIINVLGEKLGDYFISFINLKRVFDRDGYSAALDKILNRFQR